MRLPRLRLAGTTPDLDRLAAAQALSGAADALLAVSLAGSLFFSLSPEASQQQVLLYLLINMVPFVVLAPLIGPAIDHLRRGPGTIAVVLFAVRAICAVGLAFSLLDLGLYFFALALLIAAKANGVVRQALVPGLVRNPARLVAANSRLARLSVIAGAIGGAIGAGVLAISSPGVVAALAGVLFLGAAIVMARLPGVVPLRSDVPDSVSYDELHRPRIVATAWAFTMVRAAVGFFVFGLAFALRRESEPAWMYGAAVALYGAGAFLGNMAAPVLRRRYGEHHLTAGSLVVLSIVAVFAALGQSRPLVLLAAGVLGGAASVARQGFDAMVQTHAPSATHGRTFARFETRFQLAWVLGAIAATAIRIPIRISLAIVAAALIPAAVLYLRALREGHAAHADEPFNPVEVARARLDHAREWQRRGAARLAVTELAGVVDLARATGRRLDPVSVDRLDRLRGEALSTWPLDDREVTWALARATDLVEAMEHDDATPRMVLAQSARTDARRVSDDPKGRSEPGRRSPIRLGGSGGARESQSAGKSDEDVIDHRSARSSTVSTAFDRSASVR